MNARPVTGLLVALIVAACAPQPRSGGSSTTDPSLAQSQTPKVLTIALARELGSFGDFTGAGGSGGGCTECRGFAHDHLADERDDGSVVPQLAAELPSVERGTWRLNPDGSMDVTWKLRPNATWHDGTPFTSADLAFTFELYKDPDFPNLYAGLLRMMDSVTAPDPHTFVVHWSQTFVRAHREPALEPMAKHLLEPMYRSGDKESFIQTPLLKNEFVGLGPYRLTRWEVGSFMEFERFAAYYLGPPPLDRVVLQFIRDPNTMVANILAGAVDVVHPPSVDLATALDIRQRWEGTGNQVEPFVNGMLILLMPQQRPEYAMPKNGFVNRTVRQAFYSAIDRQMLAEAMAAGLAPVADSWIAPNHQLRRELEPSIPQFPYDPPRAQQLLATVGWTRGPDGVLTHQASGERFEVEVWAKAGYSEKPIAVVADGWSTIGAQPKLHVVPAARANDREYESTQPGAFLSNPPGDGYFEDYRLYSEDISAASNRWTGKNKPGYSNPRYDSILDRLQATIDPREQINLHRQLLQEGIGDLGIMPLYWEVVPFLLVQGVARGQSAFEWRKES